MADLVSVVIPTCNRAGLLPRAIKSVLRQTYSNLECIVVDDASLDNTPEVIESFSDQRLIYLRQDRSLGASAARNTGIHAAQGNLIAFLDDDDEWLPAKLERQVPVLQQAPTGVGLVYCWLDYYENGRLIHGRHPTLRGDVFAEMLDSQRIGNSSTLLVWRAVIEEIGGFDESLPRGNDGDLIRRICRKYSVDVVPEVLVHVHVGHQYRRITTDDRAGIMSAIKGQQAKLEKFSDCVDRYPRQFANIYGIIAYHYGQLGDWGRSLSFFRKAVLRDPLALTVYFRMAKSLPRLMRRGRLS